MRIAPRRKVIVHGVMLGLLLACGAFVACSGGGTPATYQEGGDSGVPVVVPDGATGGKDVTAKDVVTVDVVAKDVTVKDVGAIDVEVKDVTVKDVVVFDGNAPVYLKDVVVVEDVQEVDVVEKDVAFVEDAGSGTTCQPLEAPCTGADQCCDTGALCAYVGGLNQTWCCMGSGGSCASDDDCCG